jgi:homoserine dehydrogenase
LQKPDENNNALLLLSTHICKEKDIKEALEVLENLSYVSAKPAMIRIEA